MKHTLPTILVAVGIISLACGCNKTESTQPAGETAAPAAAPASIPAPAAVVETVKTAAIDLAAKFVEQAKGAADTQLAPIASELTGKMQALATATGANDAIKSKLESVLQSLINSQNAAAVGSAFEIAKVAEAAKLTPQQLTLAKEVGNLASAFVVQKDFSALEGAQGDVAAIVKSLRSGEITSAIPALKNVATNAHLSDSQKQIITSIADKYAPGWQKAGQVLDAVKKLPGF